MNSTLKIIRDRFVVNSLLLAMKIVSSLPLEVVQTLGTYLGKLAYYIPGLRQSRVFKHLEIAYPEPDYDDKFRRRLARKSYECMVNYGMESMWIQAWEREKDHDRLIVKDPENWAKVKKHLSESDKGLVIFASHLGSPELSGCWLRDEFPERPMMSITALSKIEGLTEKMIELREQTGWKMLIRRDGIRPALRHIYGGGILVMFVDHNLEGSGIAAPFLGQPAHTLLAPARLALQSGAMMTTMTCVRGEKGKFYFYCDDPIVPPPKSRDKEEQFKNEVEITLTYTKRIESYIRKYPEQFLWMHKRWKKRKQSLDISHLS